MSHAPGRRGWRRVLPAPGISLLLFAAWPMLNGSASAGQLALAAVFALTVPWFSERLRPDGLRIHAWAPLVRLTGVVLLDIVVSNVEVARRILGPESAIAPRFVVVPLSITDPHGIVTLAGIITMTPGTLSADLSEDRRFLLVHAFNVDDDAAAAEVVATIKARYEAPLMRILEGAP